VKGKQFFANQALTWKNKKTHMQNTNTNMSMSAYVHSIISLVHMDKKDSLIQSSPVNCLLKILSSEPVVLNSLSQLPYELQSLTII